jgi:hypothetical protein
VRWLDRFVRFPWVRSSPAPKATLVVWLALAALSVGSTWWACWRFGASTDFFWVRSWLDAWHFGAHNPYHSAGLELDYPPWALIVLSPLGWFGGAKADFAYLLVNSVVSVVAAWQLVQWVAELVGAKTTPLESTALAAMLLSTRPLRVGLLYGQTMPFAVLCFVAAMRFAMHRRPIWSGLCFALASFKLNLAVAFGLVLAALGSWEALAAGLAGTVGLFLISCACFHEAPVALALDYLGSLERIYGGPDFTPGATGVRSLFAAVTTDYSVVQGLYAAFAAASFAWIAWAVRVATARGMNRAVLGSTVFLWTFLLLPNQAYNLPLVLPVLWLTHWPETSLIRTAWLRWTAATMGLVYFIPNVPFAVERRAVVWWYRVNDAVGGALDVVWPHRARVVVLLLFAVLLFDIWRRAHEGRSVPQPSIQG